MRLPVPSVEARHSPPVPHRSCVCTGDLWLRDQANAPNVSTTERLRFGGVLERVDLVSRHRSLRRARRDQPLNQDQPITRGPRHRRSDLATNVADAFSMHDWTRQAHCYARTARTCRLRREHHHDAASLHRWWRGAGEKGKTRFAPCGLNALACAHGLTLPFPSACGRSAAVWPRCLPSNHSAQHFRQSGQHPSARRPGEPGPRRRARLTRSFSRAWLRF
jgi:hypothetical protein